MSSITLNTKVYTGIGFNQNGQSVFKEVSAGVPSGFSYLTDKVTTNTGKTDSTVKWNLSIPIVASADSDCSCAGDVLRTYYVRVEVTAPAGSTAEERLDVYTRLKDLVATTAFSDSVKVLNQAS